MTRCSGTSCEQFPCTETSNTSKTGMHFQEGRKRSVVTKSAHIQEAEQLSEVLVWQGSELAEE